MLLKYYKILLTSEAGSKGERMKLLVVANAHQPELLLMTYIGMRVRDCIPRLKHHSLIGC